MPPFEYQCLKHVTLHYAFNNNHESLLYMSAYIDIHTLRISERKWFDRERGNLLYMCIFDLKKIMLTIWRILNSASEYITRHTHPQYLTEDNNYFFVPWETNVPANIRFPLTWHVVSSDVKIAYSYLFTKQLGRSVLFGQYIL